MSVGGVQVGGLGRASSSCSSLLDISPFRPKPNPLYRMRAVNQGARTRRDDGRRRPGRNPSCALMTLHGIELHRQQTCRKRGKHVCKKQQQASKQAFAIVGVVVVVVVAGVVVGAGTSWRTCCVCAHGKQPRRRSCCSNRGPRLAKRMRHSCLDRGTQRQTESAKRDAERHTRPHAHTHTHISLKQTIQFPLSKPAWTMDERPIHRKSRTAEVERRFSDIQDRPCRARIPASSVLGSSGIGESRRREARQGRAGQGRAKGERQGNQLARSLNDHRESTSA